MFFKWRVGMCFLLLRGIGDCCLFWDGIVKYVLLFFFFFFGMCLDYVGVNVFFCFLLCDKSVCFEFIGCFWGKMLDVCGCCEVCGLDFNVICGGLFGVYGRCGEGLECVLFFEVGGCIWGSVIGICWGKLVGGLLILCFVNWLKYMLFILGFLKC